MRLLQNISLAVLAAVMAMPAQAVSPKNDNLLCAAYMDVMLEDMTPLGLIPTDKFKFMFVNRRVQLASLTLADKELPKDVVSAFVAARDKVREDQSVAVGMNDMRLFTPSQVDTYAINLANNGKAHCVKANKHLEGLMKTYTTEDFAGAVEIISNEMKAQDEN